MLVSREAAKTRRETQRDRGVQAVQSGVSPRQQSAVSPVSFHACPRAISGGLQNAHLTRSREDAKPRRREEKREGTGKCRRFKVVCPRVNKVVYPRHEHRIPALSQPGPPRVPRPGDISRCLFHATPRRETQRDREVPAVQSGVSPRQHPVTKTQPCCSQPVRSCHTIGLWRQPF